MDAPPHVPPTTHPDLAPWRPTPEDPFDTAKARHLMRRAGFDATPSELARIVAAGPRRAVERLVTGAVDDVPVWGAAILENGEVLDCVRDLESLRALCVHTAVHTRHPLVEKMAWFWHDHFSTGTKLGANARTIAAHFDLLRRAGLGSFRRLLREVTLDPAMLLYLDNYSNGRPSAAGPLLNENYARELFELFTMGVDGGYRLADVVAAAKCLSGWGLSEPFVTNEVCFRPDWHVPGPKRVLGRIIDHDDGRRDLDDLIDVILAWPATARFLAGKILRRFVRPDPPDDLVEGLAATMRAVRYDMASVMRVVLRSRAFFAPSARLALVKSPIELVGGSLVQLERPPVSSYRELGREVVAMGLPLLDYQTPEGVPGGRAWLRTQHVIRRLAWGDRLMRTGPARLVRWRPARLAADWAERMLGEAATPAVRARTEERIAAAPDLESGVRDAVRLLVASPHYQLA